jgi:hypothetical protein
VVGLRALTLAAIAVAEKSITAKVGPAQVVRACTPKG